jgi:16S rRNA C967 or C1407 C5-methylase (RsmB/RsmF family)
MGLNQTRVMNAALDCLARFKTSSMPLKNVAHELIVDRKLNSTERKALLDLVFKWSRQVNLVASFFAEQGTFWSRLPSQKKDLVALTMLGDYNADDALAGFRDPFLRYVASLKDLAPLKSLGEFWESCLTKYYGDQAIAVAQGFWQKPVQYLAYDPKAVNADSLKAELLNLGLHTAPKTLLPDTIGLTEGGFSLERLSAETRPHVWMMDAASQLAASLITASPGEKVLDMCAGVGVKTRYLSTRMNGSDLTAMDIDERRINHARKALPQQGIKFVVADGENNNLPAASFDWILLDAPCTGSGVLRRHPDMIHRMKPSDLKIAVERQKKLLKSAVKLLRVGGKLIYSTCSILPSENEEQILQALKENSQLKSYCPDGNSELFSQSSFKDISLYSCLLLPHVNDCDGFFVSCLTRITK